MYKKILPILLLTALVIASIYFLSPQNHGLTHLRIGYQPSTHQIAHMTAMEKGWWKEDLATFGVKKVTDYEFPSGPPEMQAMLAGDLDIAYVGATPPITATYEGLDAKIVAGVQIQGSHLAIRPSINYTSLKDLRGVKIATFPPGSIQDTVMRKWLIDNGLDPDKDLEIKPMSSGEAITAIGAGAVDGVFLPHPGPAIVELEGSGRIVVGSGEMWPNHTCCCLVVSGRLIREHPEVVDQIIRAHMKATEYNINNPEEAAEIYARKVGWDVEKVQYSLDTWDGHWVSDPHIGMDITLEYARVIYELNKPRYERVLTKEEIFDTSFYDKIIRESQK